MTTKDFTTDLFCRVDDSMKNVPNHSHAVLFPSEVVTIGLLFAPNLVCNPKKLAPKVNMIKYIYNVKKLLALTIPLSILLSGCASSLQKKQDEQILHQEKSHEISAVRLDPVSIINTNTLQFKASIIENVKTGQYNKINYSQTVTEREYSPFMCVWGSITTPLWIPITILTGEIGHALSVQGDNCFGKLKSHTESTGHSEPVDMGIDILDTQTKPYTGLLHIFVENREIMSENFVQGVATINIQKLTQANMGNPPTEIEATIEYNDKFDKQVFKIKNFVENNRLAAEEDRRNESIRKAEIEAGLSANAKITSAKVFKHILK